MNDFKLSILFVLQKVKTNKKGECPLSCRLTVLKSRKEYKVLQTLIKLIENEKASHFCEAFFIVFYILTFLRGLL